MTEEKKRLILEPEDYEEFKGFLFLFRMFRINEFEPAPTEEPIKLLCRFHSATHTRQCSLGDLIRIVDAGSCEICISNMMELAKFK